MFNVERKDVSFDGDGSYVTTPVRPYAGEKVQLLGSEPLMLSIVWWDCHGQTSRLTASTYCRMSSYSWSKHYANYRYSIDSVQRYMSSLSWENVVEAQCLPML
jgi:hypothetical protein